MTHSLEHNAAPARVPPGSGGSPPGELQRSASDGMGQRNHRSLWQELVAGASERSLHDWLQTAGSEGILYAHQLSACSKPPNHVVTDILAGRTDCLQPIPARRALDLEWQDRELDDSQREAVVQALVSPDLFLIQGSPGTGKTRVVAEIILQAARRGERVLLLSPGKAALDRMLDSLGPRDELVAVRCVGAQEDVSRLPAQVRRHIYAERSGSFVADTQRRAEHRCRAAEQRIESAHRERDLAAIMRPLAAEWESLEGESRALLARRQRVAEQLEQEGLSAELRALLAAEADRHQQAQHTLQNKQAVAEPDCRQIGAEHRRWLHKVAGQESLIAARTQKRWFSLRYWRARLQGRPEQRLEEFRQRATETGQALQEAEAHLRELEQQSEFETQRHRTAVQQLQQAEIGRRQGEIDAALHQVQARQRELELTWESRRNQLANPATVGKLPATAAAQALYQEAEQRIQTSQNEAELARDWLRTLERISDQLPARFHEAVNLVLAGSADIAGDPWFGDRAAQGSSSQPQFDVLILEQADRWPESELLAHVGRANRCILVGQTPLPELPRAAGGVGAQPASQTQPAPRHFSAFHRLWAALHCDPRRLPYQWTEDASRLTCRLQPIGSEQSSRIEVERLVDHPEVELRILARPQKAPVLVEVIFPVDQFTIHAAKAYLFQQLGELTLRPTAAALRWRSDNGALCLETGDAAVAASGVQRVELEEGVSEIVAGGHGRDHGRTPLTWSTLRLEFDGTKGWDRVRAEAWLRERAGLGSLTRTALLETQYRCSGPIASFCNQVLGEPALRVAGARDHLRLLPAAVECVSVPYQRERPRPRTRGPQRPAPPQAKSFEIDLSDAKQRQRVPLDLQLRLPAKGLVNFAEAQAIIHRLDLLARAPELGQQGKPVSVAVLSWQASQVQFLQALWAGAAASHPGVTVRFETVAGFRDHEADIVLVSLCRSNAQRVVGFADYPEEWRWALTGARSSVLVFGDPDMLSRRARWTGAVNRQTEMSAAAERVLVERLIPHFVGQARRSPGPQGVRT